MYSVPCMMANTFFHHSTTSFNIPMLLFYATGIWAMAIPSDISRECQSVGKVCNYSFKQNFALYLENEAGCFKLFGDPPSVCF